MKRIIKSRGKEVNGQAGRIRELARMAESVASWERKKASVDALKASTEI